MLQNQGVSPILFQIHPPDRVIGYMIGQSHHGAVKGRNNWFVITIILFQKASVSQMHTAFFVGDFKIQGLGPIS